MGVDTNGRLIGNVRPEEVLNYIRQKYDTNAKSNIKMDNYGIIKEDWIKVRYDNDDIWRITDGFIEFTYNSENRRLFYYKSNINSYENLEFYSKYNLEDMVKSETTSISLGCWGNSIEIIKDIVAHFGGWIDENDCDDEEFYPIIKNSDGNIIPVIYVTQEELNKKFGGIVVIK